MSPSPRVAVLGIGRMGLPVARQLARSGFSVNVYNRRRSIVRSLGAHRNLHPKDTAREAAVDAKFVVNLLFDDEATRRVWEGPRGVLEGLQPGTTVIQMATLSAGFVSRWERALHSRGARVVNAPVTGSVSRASAGTLIAFVGGRASDVISAQPVLRATTLKQYRFRDVAASASYKLLHNLAAAQQLAALAEVLSLARITGLDTRQAVEILTTWGWTAPVASARGAAMLNEDYSDVAFSLQGMMKDVSLARELAGEDDYRITSATVAAFEAASRIHDGVVVDMSAVGSVFSSRQRPRSLRSSRL